MVAYFGRHRRRRGASPYVRDNRATTWVALPIAGAAAAAPRNYFGSVPRTPEWLRRLPDAWRGPRLVQDPPPYRRSPILRGPRHLPLEIARISD